MSLNIENEDQLTPRKRGGRVRSGGWTDIYAWDDSDARSIFDYLIKKKRRNTKENARRLVELAQEAVLIPNDDDLAPFFKKALDDVLFAPTVLKENKYTRRKALVEKLIKKALAIAERLKAETEEDDLEILLLAS